MEQQNEIGIESVGSVTLFDIKGDVTALTEPFLNDAYEKASGQGATKFLFKFDPEAYINSGGIAVLIQILAETSKNQQATGITGLSDHFKKIFSMVGITRFAKVYNTVEEALEHMSEGS
jgi:anti-anti-sigma factor